MTELMIALALMFAVGIVIKRRRRPSQIEESRRKMEMVHDALKNKD